MCFGVMYACSNVVFNVGSTNKLDREHPAFCMSELKLMLELFP